MPNPIREVNKTGPMDFTGLSTDVQTSERTFTRGEGEGDSGLVEVSGVVELPDEPTGVPTNAAAPAMGAPRFDAWSPPTAPAAPRPILLDVTPRALCVATVGGYCDEIIRRNSQIPVEQTRVFTTAHDNQTSVEIRVGQGESRQFADNTLLGSLVLDGLESKTRGEQRIAVTFEIDTDGILQVRAVDQATQRAQSARIELLGVASEADVGAAKERLQGLRAR
jgi:molecular chaperone DnaK